MLCQRCSAECDYSPCNGKWCAEPKHLHTVKREKTTHADEHGVRIVQSCECGAYRTREISSGHSFRVMDSGWLTLTETYRCA